MKPLTTGIHTNPRGFLVLVKQLIFIGQRVKYTKAVGVLRGHPRFTIYSCASSAGVPASTVIDSVFKIKLLT